VDAGLCQKRMRPAAAYEVRRACTHGGYSVIPLVIIKRVIYTRSESFPPCRQLEGDIDDFVRSTVLPVVVFIIL
jgi:hypothetical protein